MGITPSVNIPVPKEFNYFALSFGHTDRLRLILAPESIEHATGSLISSMWKIQETSKMNGFIEYKIYGTPWCTTGIDDVNNKYFICQLLKLYYSYGWHLMVSTDLERFGSGKTVLIFEKREPVNLNVMCLSLNESDKIRVLAPEPFIQKVRYIIQKNWPLGIQRERQLGNSWEFKLKGNPWNNDWSEPDSSYTVSLVNQFLSQLLESGLVLAGAIKSNKRQLDVDSLYFIQEPFAKPLPTTHSLTVSLKNNDRIKFIQAKPDQLGLIKNFVQQKWFAGIQDSIFNESSCEFKLRGNPWWANGAEAVTSRKFFGDLLQFLCNNGYILYGSCDLTRNLSSKSTFFFRSKLTDMHNPPTYSNVICLSLNENDKIRLIDANQNIVNMVRASIINSWPDGIQDESNYYNSWEFKLSGYPFSSNSSNQVYCALMMMHILSSFRANNYRFITSADLSGKYHSDDKSSYKLDLHTWYFEECYDNS